MGSGSGPFWDWVWGLASHVNVGMLRRGRGGFSDTDLEAHVVHQFDALGAVCVDGGCRARTDLRALLVRIARVRAARISASVVDAAGFGGGAAAVRPQLPDRQ